MNPKMNMMMTMIYMNGNTYYEKVAKKALLEDHVYKASETPPPSTPFGILKFKVTNVNVNDGVDAFRS